MKRLMILTILIIALFSCKNNSVAQTNTDGISGTLKDGLRVLTVNKGESLPSWKVYRGDYIQVVNNDNSPLTLEIADLSVKKDFPVKSGETPYVKMKTTGTFSYTIDGQSSTIEVIEYTRPNYQAVNAEEAKHIIKNISPVILDVRTSGEYNGGHIEGAILIPVQVLEQSISQIAKYKNSDILVYCASGNRSTVASKILIDNGFKKIYNMRYGIKEWYQNRYPVVK